MKLESCARTMWFSNITIKIKNNGQNGMVRVVGVGVSLTMKVNVPYENTLGINRRPTFYVLLLLQQVVTGYYQICTYFRIFYCWILLLHFYDLKKNITSIKLTLLELVNNPHMTRKGRDLIFEQFYYTKQQKAHRKSARCYFMCCCYGTLLVWFGQFFSTQFIYF